MTTLPKLTWTRRDSEHEYQLTDDDYETLLRAVAHEGPPVEGVVWCLLQRFAWIWPTYPSLAEFVSAYAQPINPRWFSDGDLHLKFMERNRRKPARLKDEARRAARRVEYARQAVGDIDERIRAVVDKILSGSESTTVEGAVHYSASFARRGSNARTAQVAAGQFAKTRGIGPVVDSGAGYRRGVNWFFGAGGSHRVNMHLAVVIEQPEPVAETESDGCVS